MGTGITDIEINPDWFYRRVSSLNIDKYILSGSIKAKKYLKKDQITKKEATWNGNYYISLAKHRKDLSPYDSCYQHFIEGQYAFIFEDIEAIKTKTIEDFLIFYQTLAKLPIKKDILVGKMNIR